MHTEKSQEQDRQAKSAFFSVLSVRQAFAVPAFGNEKHSGRIYGPDRHHPWRGRDGDFHNFNLCFRDDPAYQVIAFTAAQIPQIAGRRYPPELAGGGYPEGIPIFPEAELLACCAAIAVGQAVFSYSDIAYHEVLHLAALVTAAGAAFLLLAPGRRCCRAPGR